MARGEIEYQKAIIDNQSGYKDEVVLAIVILPILVIAYSVFSGQPDAKEKLDLFFEYFNNLPDWYVWLTVGIFGSIYGLKPGLDLFFHYFNNFPEFYKWLVLGIFSSIYGLKPGMDLLKKK